MAIGATAGIYQPLRPVIALNPLNTSVRVDLEPVLASPYRSKLRPESGEPKGSLNEGATMGRKGAGSCRIPENAAVER